MSGKRAALGDARPVDKLSRSSELQAKPAAFADCTTSPCELLLAGAFSMGRGSWSMRLSVRDGAVQLIGLSSSGT
jgi:hypothetical protein